MGAHWEAAWVEEAEGVLVRNREAEARIHQSSTYGVHGTKTTNKTSASRDCYTLSTIRVVVVGCRSRDGSLRESEDD